MLASLSTTITDITPNLESVGPLSQEIEFRNKKQNNTKVISLIMNFTERDSLSKFLRFSYFNKIIINKVNAFLFQNKSNDEILR